MRFTVLLFTALLAIGTCHLAAGSNSKEEAADFFGGLYSHFNLSNPDQIISCFDDHSAEIFFEALYEKFEILKDTTQRKSLKLHIEYGKLLVIMKLLKPLYSCMTVTQDFVDLLDALNITQRNPDVLHMIAYLNYQAHYDDLFAAFQPLIINLNAGNFTEAGQIYGQIKSDAVQTVKEEGLARLSYNGFANGEAIRLEIDEPSDSLECYDNNSSALYIHFLYRLAVVVTEGNPCDTYENAVDFLENEGRDIMNQFPDGVMECERASVDHQKRTDKLGIDIFTDEFLELMRGYTSHHHYKIFAELTGLRKSIENHNFVHAGEIYAHFLSNVADTKSDELFINSAF